MKSRSAAVLLLVTTALCGLPLIRPADDATAPRVVNIRAGVENMIKFDVTSIAATPGESIKVILTNAGTLPKSVMGHNWILLTAGSDPVAFAAAATTAAESGYIPAKLKDKILAFIPLLGPGESGEVTFMAPMEPGEYPFLCSFPGHCLVGMKGVLVVKK
jgi:azurin